MEAIFIFCVVCIIAIMTLVFFDENRMCQYPFSLELKLTHDWCRHLAKALLVIFTIAWFTLPVVGDLVPRTRALTPSESWLLIYAIWAVAWYLVQFLLGVAWGVTLALLLRLLRLLAK